MDVDNDKTIIRPRPGGRPAAGDDDRTVIRPRPGGERAAIAAANGDATVMLPRRRPSAEALTLREVPGFGRNRLLDAAGTLLSLAARLGQVQTQLDVDRLHAQTVAQVQAFQRTAGAAGIERSAVDRGCYLLCALLDETVLNTHWGEHSAWSQKSLLGKFFQQTAGGERVFALIDEALAAVRHDHDFLELAYHCLSLGFEGKYRIDPRGKDKLEQIRAELYQSLHVARDRYRKELAPAARPSHDIKRRLNSFLPVWVAAAVLALAGFGLFSYLLLDLNQRSDRLQAELAALVPPPAVAATSVNVQPQALGLRQALASEIDRGVLQVQDYPNRVSIVLNAEELFGSGSAAITEGYRPVLDKIAMALERIPGQVVVSGHTDNTPIRTTRFPSNWHLSLARASAVVRHLAEVGELAGRLLPEGRADTEPVADNDTPQGRARNRRVVIDLYHGRT